MPTTTTEDILSWIRERAFVLHLPTGTVGVATRYFDGVLEKWIHPVHGPVSGPVFELDPGHALVASDPAVFSRLTDQEALVHASFAEQHAELARETMRFAAKNGVDPSRTMISIVSVMREQARAMGSPIPAPPQTLPRRPTLEDVEGYVERRYRAAVDDSIVDAGRVPDENTRSAAAAGAAYALVLDFVRNARFDT